MEEGFKILACLLLAIHGTLPPACEQAEPLGSGGSYLLPVHKPPLHVRGLPTKPTDLRVVDSPAIGVTPALTGLQRGVSAAGRYPGPGASLHLSLLPRSVVLRVRPQASERIKLRVRATLLPLEDRLPARSIEAVGWVGETQSER